MTSQRNRPSTLQRVVYTLGAIVAGVVVGSLLNVGTIVLGSSLLPPPAGVDVNDVASINASIEQYSVAQLLVPFVAHALGTLVGAWVAALVARRVETVKVAASVIALLFLAGWRWRHDDDSGSAFVVRRARSRTCVSADGVAGCALGLAHAREGAVATSPNAALATRRTPRRHDLYRPGQSLYPEPRERRRRTTSPR